MCNNCTEIKVEELVNIQTGKKIDMEKFNSLPDNALLKVRPDLWCQWNFEKNDELGYNVYNMTKGMGKKVNWICEMGHHHYIPIYSKVTSKNGCKVCDGKEIIVGFNDMWTTNPELASLLANTEDGFKYAKSSDKKVDWKCPDCGEIIKNKRIGGINKYGLSCPKCSDGIKYPEKVMLNVLSQLNITFIHDSSFKWSNRRRYDFYIPSLNMIIETHGGQHLGKGFNTIGGRSYKEEKENDKVKRELALQNGIKSYFEIDCSKSELEFIKENILNSKMIEHFNFNNVDWDKVNEFSRSSLSKEALRLWNNGLKDAIKIAEKLNLHHRTVHRYLKFWSNLGKSDFNDYLIDTRRKVVQLSLKHEFIKQWDSISEASEKYSKNIIKVCQGHRDKCCGYRWMYLEDYENFLKTNETPYVVSDENKVHSSAKNIVQLNDNLELIKEYKSMLDAVKENNYSSNATISKVCKGIAEKAFGFKWMYKEDYEKYLLTGELPYQTLVKKIRTKPIVKLNKDLELIEEYISTEQAALKNGIKSKTAITNVCNGLTRTCGGFSWMYLDDYNKFLKTGISNLPEIHEPYQRRKVVKLDKNLQYIDKYNSLQEASSANNIKSYTHISSVCNSKRKIAGGFKWMYLEDYEEYLKTGICPIIEESERKEKSCPVVKLNNELELLDTYNSIKSAMNENNIKSRSGIIACCRGRRNTSAGFKWMYLSDYENMIKQNESGLA